MMKIREDHGMPRLGHPIRSRRVDFGIGDVLRPDCVPKLADTRPGSGTSLHGRDHNRDLMSSIMYSLERAKVYRVKWEAMAVS